MRTTLISGALISLLGVSMSSLAQGWTATGAPAGRWSSLACSADGSKLFVLGAQPGLIYGSTNSGGSWFFTGAPSNSWSSLASSADGTRLVATVAFVSQGAARPYGGPIYTSTDSGASWQMTTAPTNEWSAVASSADGSTLLAAAANDTTNAQSGLIFLSTNSGTVWTATGAPTNGWYSVACSADGNRIIAAAAGIFISSNKGAEWTSNNIAWDFPAGSARWTSVASSSDGLTLMAIREATVYTGGTAPRVYTSTNSGETWTWFNLATTGRGLVAISAEGSRLMVSKAHLYLSTDSGVTWLQQNIPGQTYGWGQGCPASSADGMRLFLALGADDFGQPNAIFTRSWPPRPKLELAPSGADLMLSWLVPSANVVVQQITDLTRPGWVALTNTPALNSTNLHYQVNLSTSTGAAFFRLATP